MAVFRHRGDDFVLEEVNPAGHALVPESVQTFLGRNASEIYRDRPDQLEVMQRAWAGQTRVVNPRALRVLSGGREIMLRLEVAPLSEDQLVLHAIEVTAQVAAEERLAASRRRNEILFDEAAIGIVRLDDLGVIVEANRAAAALLKRDAAELAGIRFTDLAARVDEKDAPRGGVAEAPEPAVTDWMVSGEDRTVRIVEVSERPLEDGGKLLFLHDLTPHYDKRSQLQRREEQTYRMIEFFPDAIAVATDGVVVYANVQFLRLAGASESSDVIGRELLSFVEPDDLPYVAERIGRLEIEGSIELSPAPYRMVRLDGSSISVEVAGLMIEYDGEPSMLFVLRDVGERERQQEALRRSEARYRGLFNTSSDLIYRISIEGRVLETNEAAVRVAGWNVEEMIGRSFRDFVHRDDLNAAIEAFQRTMTEGSASVVLRIVRRDGTFAYLDTMNNAEMADGRAVALFGMARDITARRLAEEQIQERERLIFAVLDGLPIGVVVADAQGTIVRSNPAADAIWGFHRTQTAYAAPHVYRGWRVSDGRPIDADDWPSTRALRHGETLLNELIEIERRDGTRRVILNSAVPLRDEEGRISGVVILNQDVTEIRRKELEQQAADARLQEIISSTSDGICTVDAQGRATLVSPAAAAMLGVPEAALIGLDLHAVIHETDRPNVFTEVMQSRTPQPLYQDVFVRRDGGSFEVEVSCAPILIDDVADGAVITFRDVTRRNLLERELELAQRFAAIGQLAATVSHEFNNVLMGINPFAEVIARRAAGDDRLRTAAERIQEALRRGKQITREILKFAQAAEPRMIPTRLRELVELAIPELQAISGAGITIHVPPIDEDLAAAVDSIQVHQALSNLVANARDAMNGRGAIEIAAHVATPDRMRDLEDGEWVCLSVADAGPGIEPAILERIFEPLFTTKEAGGTGLGLPVVQQVVSRHGGHVEVESRAGAGTKFKLFFRRSPPPSAAEPASQDRPRTAARTVLLVEDDLTVAAGLEGVLELEGITTHLVTLGGDAEEAVERFSPDAVLIDRGLPDMDGIDVARVLLARWPRLPLIFSTGHGSRAELRQFPPDARMALLEKPYDVAKLLEVLARLFG